MNEGRPKGGNGSGGAKRNMAAGVQERQDPTRKLSFRVINLYENRFLMEEL